MAGISPARPRLCRLGFSVFRQQSNQGCSAVVCCATRIIFVHEFAMISVFDFFFFFCKKVTAISPSTTGSRASLAARSLADPARPSGHYRFLAGRWRLPSSPLPPGPLLPAAPLRPLLHASLPPRCCSGPHHFLSSLRSPQLPRRRSTPHGFVTMAPRCSFLYLPREPSLTANDGYHGSG
jgi:hypothetical protein